MKSIEARSPDTQYRDVLADVLKNGLRANSQQGTDAITLIGPRPMRFKFENGFPMITERNMAPACSDKLPVTIWKQAIAEISAFINGAVTVEELEQSGCHWWKHWGTPEKCAKRGLPAGNLGPGSYGAAFHDFPMLNGDHFNQFQHIVEQINEEPQLRTHFVSPWIPQYIGRGKGKRQQVVVAPCHGWVNVRIIDGKLILNMFQRSGDLPVGVPSNMVQYAALTMMLARVTGYEAYEYVHTISDAHIFVDQNSCCREDAGTRASAFSNNGVVAFGRREKSLRFSERRFRPLGLRSTPRHQRDPCRDMSTVDLANSRGGEQTKVMEQIVGDNVCPFCTEHLRKYHQHPIIKEGKFWLLTRNQWPYKNTRIHLLAILKSHVEHLADVDAEAGKELFELGQWIAKEFDLIGGALCMRFGDTKHSAGTVLHLHAHFISPDIEAPDYEPVRFKIGADK